MPKEAEIFINDLIARLRVSLPTAFTRPYISKELGGLFSKGGLANIDAEGAGPPGVTAGKYRIYEKESFLLWLQARLLASLK